MTDLDTERFSAYETYLRAAAGQLGKPLDDDTVKIVASTRLQLDLVIEAQLAGRTPDTGDLLKIGDTLRSFAPEPVREHEVVISYVKGVTGICPACKARIPDYMPPPVDAVIRDVTPIASTVTETVTDAKVLEPDKIIPRPAKRVRHDEQSEEPLFSMCTIGKGVQTSDRWSR